MPDIRICRCLDAVDILFAVSNLLNADDEWPENVDRMCMCTVQRSANGYHGVAPTILEAMTANEQQQKMEKDF